ncbi:MAG: P1 family peptidase [Candidatus Woesebacteria bacterium]|jgi:L-aminopeptidase/D-esterase-like protein
MNNTLTALKGVRVGHATFVNDLTGCTVVVFDKDYPVAYAAYGGTPRTYDTTTLDQGKSFYRKHALYVSDGAHTGLETAAHIAKALRKQNIGYKIGKNIIPSISGACVQSMGMYVKEIDPGFGATAVQNISDSPVQSGNVGAGTGTSVGKFSFNPGDVSMAMKAGVGSAKIDLGGGAIVTAMSVVNAMGNIIDDDGQIIAGNRHDDDSTKFRTFEGFSNFLTEKSNTTISIVGTNIKLNSQEDLRRIAEIASHGQVRAINPVNTSLDGDTVFVFSTEEINLPLSKIGKLIENSDWYKISVDVIAQAAAKAIQKSIYDAVYSAKTVKFNGAYMNVIPSAKDYNGSSPK